jgi:hypothetical protein
MQLSLNGRQRHVHNCGVEHDHELADAQDHQGDPATAVRIGTWGAHLRQVALGGRHLFAQQPETCGIPSGAGGSPLRERG